MSDTPATLDMLKIKTLVEATRLLDKQHAVIVDCTHTEDSEDMVREFIEYIDCVADHRRKLLELSVEEFAALKVELGKKDE
jgi:hypothetical protein